jgi:penicillin-binding protein 1A
MFLLGLLGIFLITRDMPSVKLIEISQTDLATRVVSVDGQILGSYFQDQNRIDVKLNDVPVELVNALIATEDIRFYEHSGLDMKGFFNIFINGFLKSVFGVGQVTGGSTITQQLARNLYDKQVGRDRSVKRKVKEAFAAIYLESRLTKKEIVEHYLNTVPWGGSNYGIQAAAADYFNKQAQELTPSESALLIGMLKGSSRYDPRRKPDNARNRRNTVIEQMVKYELATEAQAAKWKKEPLNVQPSRGLAHNQGIATYFREYLRRDLIRILAQINKEQNRTGEDSLSLYTSGLRVYTTIDARMQEHAERAMCRHLSYMQLLFDKELRSRGDSLPWVYDPQILERAMRQSARYQTLKDQKWPEAKICKHFQRDRVRTRLFAWKYADDPATPKRDILYLKSKSGQIIGTEAQASYLDTTITPWDSLKYAARILETGIVTIEPETGHVKAWVGGLDHEFFKYDHVKTSIRQVGSTFKPFLYATAFANGISPCEKFLNEPVTIESLPGVEPWSPKNVSQDYGGEMDLRTALTRSVNVVAARLIEQVKPQNVAKKAADMGIVSKELEKYKKYPSIALGTFDLSVHELTAGYATMANKGIYREPVVITRIEDKKGQVVYLQRQTVREALREEVAWVMTDVLRSVVQRGTAASLHWKYDVPYDVYACGKTGTTQNNSDAWFVGFTPRLCTGVWVGCGDRSVHFDGVQGQGGMLALPIWALYMREAYADPTLKIDKKKTFVRPRELTIEMDCSQHVSTLNTPASDPSSNPGTVPAQPQVPPRRETINFDD